MAAPSLTLSNPGVINGDSGTWAKDNALFLKVFSGEVLTAFKRSCIFEPFTQVRTIQNGRSAQFPVTGRFTAKYTTPGEMLVGQGDMAQNEVVIRIDDYLIADATLYSLQEAKAHYDIRSIYSTELGEALAREHDKRIARTIAIGAATATTDLTADLPSGLSPDDPFRTGTIVDINKATPTADDFVAAAFAAAEALDRKDISSDNRVLACTPEAYYTMLQSSRLVNADFNQPGANGSYASGTVARVAGFNIVVSNNIAQGSVTAKTGEQGYVSNGSVKKSTVDMTNTHMLAFQKGGVGVVKLRDISVGQTGNDYDVMYNATLMTTKMAVGVGCLRPECCVSIVNDA